MDRALFHQLWLLDTHFLNKFIEEIYYEVFISEKMKKLKAGSLNDCHLAQINSKSFIQIQISPAFLQAYNKF